MIEALGLDVLPTGTRVRLVPAVNGPAVHAREAAELGHPVNRDIWQCPQGVQACPRAYFHYFHYESAGWADNKPVGLDGWTASELARILTSYHTIDTDRDMAATVAAEMPAPVVVANCSWLPEHECRIYRDEYARTTFQGGLQWCRCRTQGAGAAELQLLSGKSIDIPSLFIIGAQDCRIYQASGRVRTHGQYRVHRLRGCHVLPRRPLGGAGARNP